MDYSILRNLFGLTFRRPLLAHELMFYGISYITEKNIDFSRSHTFHELLIALDGELGVDTNGNIVTIQEGDLLYIGPQVQRRLKIFPDVPIKYILIDFDIVKNPEQSDFPAESWIVDEEQLVRQLFLHQTAACRDNGSVLSHVNQICAIMEQNLVGTPSLLAALLSNLVICALQCFSGSPVRQKAVMVNENHLTSKAVRVNEYIQSHFTESITVQAVADALNYSTRHLQRIIMEYYSVSFSDLVLQYRLALAKNLLGLSADSIETISEKCGFPSMRSFEKNFKEHIGITPTAFRKIFGKM